MEHVITEHIRTELESKAWFIDAQHGCESQIIALYQNLADDVDRGGRVDAVIIDFAKAFDVVPHDILIEKLDGTGIDKTVQAFLENRTQRVIIGKEISDIGVVTSGVPQGSVIGPLLFLVFINDLPVGINSENKLFADDCIIYSKIRNEHDITQLQKYLDVVSNWAMLNKMKINSGYEKVVKLG